MERNITKDKVVFSLLWKLAETVATHGVQIVVMILLTRLLLPEDFGLIVIVTVFITLAALLVESGFTMALIQKKDTDEIDYSSVFYLNLFLATVFYLILFFVAPYIATFYEKLELINVIRVLSILLFLKSFISIQIAILTRNMQFNKLFKSSFGAILASGLIGITMAYNGFGIWALVGQQLSNQFLIAIILWFTVKWRPQFVFNIERIKKLFKYSSNLLISSLMSSFNENLKNLIIGKIFSPTLLGFFSKGRQFPQILAENLNGSIQHVMFPALAANQDNQSKIKKMVQKSVSMTSFIIFPMMVGLAVIAEPIIGLILTDNWLPIVPFLQIFCAFYLISTIDTIYSLAINAIGRSDIFLKLEIIKVPLSLIILIISAQFGIYEIAFGVVISVVFNLIIDGCAIYKLLGYRLYEQLSDYFPSLILSILMGMIIYSLNWFGMDATITMFAQIVLGIFSYIGLAVIFKPESYLYLLNILQNVIGKKKIKENPVLPIDK